MDKLAYMGVTVNTERALFIQMMQTIAHKAEKETDEFWGEVYDQLQDPRKAKMMGDKWRIALEAMRFGRSQPIPIQNQPIDFKKPDFLQFLANNYTTAYFEDDQLVVPSGQGRSVPLVNHVAWQAWQTAIYLCRGVWSRVKDRRAIKHIELETVVLESNEYEGNTGQHVDWAMAPDDASHYQVKTGAFYKETPEGIVGYNSALCQWDTRICNIDLDSGTWITRPAYKLISQQTKLQIDGFATPIEKQIVINVLARFFKGLSNEAIRKELNIALAKSRNIVNAFKDNKIPPDWIEEARTTELPYAN